MMRFVRSILPTLLVVALSTYALDCEAMASPEQAMQCCAAMQCSRHIHQDANQGMDCCKTMPKQHVSFMLSSSGHSVSHSVVFAVLPTSGALRVAPSSVRTVATSSHAPPVFSPPASLPLRI